MKWITLPLSWNLGDVRAVLTFVISLLCAIGIWVSAYCRWRLQARAVSTSSSVDLLSLLSVTGVGDAIDAIFTVPWSNGFSKHIPLLLECILVVLLTAGGILAGPVSKWSVQPGHVRVNTPTDGWLATTNFDSKGAGSLVIWNQTIERLKTANFPQDQLLDYLPDIQKDWKYVADQWNSTWSMNCTYTPQTSFDAEITTSTSSNLMLKIPNLIKAFPQDISNTWNSWRSVWNYRSHRKYTEWSDLLLFYLVATEMPEFSDGSVDKSNAQPLRISLAAYHMHNVPMASTSTALINFGAGNADSAEYTAADCKIARKRQPPSEYDISYPWVEDIQSITAAMALFWEAALEEQSISSEAVYPPQPEDLSRFLQAYMVTKDTQNKHTTSRTMERSLPSVQIALATVIALGVYVVILAAASTWALLDKLLHNNEGYEHVAQHEAQRGFFSEDGTPASFPMKSSGADVPRTKLDWILQSVRESAGRDFDRYFHVKERKDLEHDARAAVFGPVSGRTGKFHIGVGRRSDKPIYTSVYVSPTIKG